MSLEEKGLSLEEFSGLKMFGSRRITKYQWVKSTSLHINVEHIPLVMPVHVLLITT